MGNQGWQSRKGKKLNVFFVFLEKNTILGEHSVPELGFICWRCLYLLLDLVGRHHIHALVASLLCFLLTDHISSKEKRFSRCSIILKVSENNARIGDVKEEVREEGSYRDS